MESLRDYSATLSDPTQGVLVHLVEDVPEAVAILYELLLNRAGSARISAQITPAYEAHAAFVREHPYRAWFLVRVGKNWVGSIYLGHDNAIGLHLHDFEANLCKTLLRRVVNTIPPLPAVPSVRAGHFIINVSPSNTHYTAVLEALGAQIVQNTFLLPMPAQDSI